METGRRLVVPFLAIAILLPGKARGADAICTAWTEYVVAPEYRTVHVGPGTQYPVGGPGTRSRVAPLGVTSMPDHERLRAIECLLGSGSDVRPALITGAQTPHASQIFARATANLAALYMISYIYTGRYDHALAVGLRGKDASSSEKGAYVTKPEAIQAAFDAYRSWFHRIRSVPLAEARKTEPDPLRGTGLRWYGSSPSTERARGK